MQIIIWFGKELKELSESSSFSFLATTGPMIKLDNLLDFLMTLRHSKISGITPFCITIDRESEAELKDLYGEVGYTIIDDVMSLPERLPGIYRRLTT